MPASFTLVTFLDPARASANISSIKSLLPPSLFSRLPGLLAQLPDPDGALNFLERYLLHDVSHFPGEPAPAPGLPPRILNHFLSHPPALHYLLVIFAYSRFLSETLIQQPDLIIWLDRPGARLPLDRMKSPEDLDEEFARFSATAIDAPPSVVLARFKRREYLRIVLRDVLGLATLAETTLEISHLADVILARALRSASQKLENAYGSPQSIAEDGRRLPASFTIFSLGKLGAQELNYNSDVDLLFLYSADGETSGGPSGSLTNAEFFVRVTQAVVKLISDTTPEGSVFRVDLRLRPQGAEGALAVSLSSAVDYYSSRAREWELQMLIKARPSAGEAPAGRAFLRRLDHLVYRPGVNLAAVEAVLNARQEITRTLHRRAATNMELIADHSAQWNVKLSPGGIRDIEFLTQCLQRVYGGADLWLRHPATLVSLQRLHDKSHLSGHDFSRLGAAYQFLRIVEHRLQLRDGLQRHTLPEDPRALDRLARRCGIEPPGPLAMMLPSHLLLERIASHFSEVREIYERILTPLSERTRTGPTSADSPADFSRPSGEIALNAVEGSPATPIDLESPSAEETGIVPRLRRDFPAVGAHVDAIYRSDDAYARRGLHRYLSSALLNPTLMRKLETRPDLLTRAAELFSRSDLAVEMLARNPEEISILADAGHQAADPAASPTARMRGRAADSLESIRVGWRRQVFSALARSLLAGPGDGEPYATCITLTRHAENALHGVLRVAFSEIHSPDRAGAQVTDLAAAPLSVLALGRLGTAEFDIGSDADLLLVVDDALSPEQREPWRRLAERFVHLVSSHTRDGLLFPVDTRLRPHGTQGDLLQTPASLREYFSTKAQAWEAASFLKARPIAGNFPLGFQALQSVFAGFTDRWKSQPDPTAALRDELLRTRQRLEEDTTDPVFPWSTATPTIRHPAELKKDPGGFFDIDYILAFSCLSLLLSPPAENNATPTPAFPFSILTPPASDISPSATSSPANPLAPAPLFDCLHSSRLITPSQITDLHSRALLFRSLDHAARLITGRATHRLPEPALASRIARLLSQWSILPSPDLPAAVSSALSSTRTLFSSVFNPT